MVSQVVSSAVSASAASLRAFSAGSGDRHDHGVSKPREDGTSRAQSIEREQSRLALNLKTQDGDRIQIRFAESESSRLSVRTSEGEVRARQVERQSERYSIRIEGELDAEERQALESVVTAAFDLAASFFDGEETDVAGVLNAARLGGDEIASLSLKLTQKSESIQKFSSRGEDDGRVSVRSAERSVERLQARFESLGNGLRSLLTEAREGPASQPAVQLARISVGVALDAVLVADSERPQVVAQPEASEASQAAEASQAPDASDEQPGTIRVASLAPPVQEVAAPVDEASNVAPESAAPVEDDAPVSQQAVAQQSRDGEPQPPASQPPASQPPAPQPQNSALDDLRNELIAALELANERGSIEIEARRVDRSESVFRLRVSA